MSRIFVLSFLKKILSSIKFWKNRQKIVYEEINRKNESKIKQPILLLLIIRQIKIQYKIWKISRIKTNPKQLTWGNYYVNYGGIKKTNEKIFKNLKFNLLNLLNYKLKKTFVNFNNWRTNNNLKIYVYESLKKKHSKPIWNNLWTHKTSN